MVPNVLLTFDADAFTFQSRDYDVIQTMATYFCHSQLKVFLFTF